MKLNRDLGLLLLGNGVSTLGTSVYLVAVLLLLKEMTESAFLLGLFQFTALIPGFILSPVTGVLVDRGSRRRIIIGADLLRGGAMTAAAFMLIVPALRSPAVVLAVSVVVGVGNAFFLPAVQALIPDIVSRNELQAANGARAASNQGFNLAGNALGGLLYTLLGAPLVFLLNGITFFLSAVQELAIRAPRDRVRRRCGRRPRTDATREDGTREDGTRTAGTPASATRDSATDEDDTHRDGTRTAGTPTGAARNSATREDGTHRDGSVFREAHRGLVAVVNSRRMRTVFISQAGLFLLSPALVLALPFIVIDELGLTGTVVGVFFAISLAGGILAFLAAGRMRGRRSPDTAVIPLAYAILASVFFLLGSRINVVTLVVAALFFGGAAGIVYLSTVTWIQTRTDADMHGRLFALLEAGNSLVAPVSYVFTGVILDLLGAARRHWLFLILAVTAALWAGRAAGARTAGDDAEGDRAAGNRTAGDDAEGDRAAGGRAAGDDAEGDLAAGNRTAGDDAEGDRAAGGRTAGNGDRGDTHHGG